MRVPSYEPLDAALDRLSGYETGLANGNFSHAPMVAEALCAIGRPEPDFAPAIGLVDLDGDIDALIAELTELFARVYLANVGNALTAIVFIHGVTSLTALGRIVPHLDDATARMLLRYGWQAGCGLYACYGSGAGFAGEVAPWVEDADSLVARALANGDEHVIKFAEACLYRHALAPSPAYPAAIANALRMIGRR